MIYEVCEALREQIGEMNDLILRKLKQLNDKDSLDQGLKTSKFSSDAPLTFTPVTQETFAKWCDIYKEKMRKLKDELISERDLKDSGRQLFMLNKNIIDEIKIGEDEDDEEFKDD